MAYVCMCRRVCVGTCVQKKCAIHVEVYVCECMSTDRGIPFVLFRLRFVLPRPRPNRLLPLLPTSCCGGSISPGEAASVVDSSFNCLRSRRSLLMVSVCVRARVRIGATRLCEGGAAAYPVTSTLACAVASTLVGRAKDGRGAGVRIWSERN